MAGETQSEASGLKKELEEAVGSGKQEDITSVFKKAFVNVLELKITTTVTEGTFEGISTTINLLEGDIHTTISKSYIPDAGSLADFHKEQVSKAEQIIERNVNTLKSLAQGLADLF